MQHSSQEIYKAVKLGNASKVLSLLSGGISPDLTNDSNSTALHLAAEFNQAEIVKLLLYFGASVGLKDSHSSSPIQIAVSHGHTRVADLLIQAGCDVTERNADGDTLLHLASRNKADDCMAALLNTGADANALNNEQSAPLHLVSTNEGIELLLCTGADPNSLNIHGVSPTCAAAARAPGRGLQRMFETGADFSVPDKQGNSPLHIAATFGNLSGLETITEIYRQTGVNIDCKNQADQTPLYVAVYYGTEKMNQIADALLRAGAGIEHAIVAVADQYAEDPESKDFNKRRLHHALLSHLLTPDLPPALRYDDALGAVLQLFCRRGAPEEDLLLLLRHCNHESANYTNEHADTPLAEYVKSRAPKASVVKALLDAGAITLINGEGNKPRSVLEILHDRNDDFDMQEIETLLLHYNQSAHTNLPPAPPPP